MKYCGWQQRREKESISRGRCRGEITLKRERKRLSTRKKVTTLSRLRGPQRHFHSRVNIQASRKHFFFSNLRRFFYMTLVVIQMALTSLFMKDGAKLTGNRTLLVIRWSQWMLHETKISAKMAFFFNLLCWCNDKIIVDWQVHRNKETADSASRFIHPMTI